LQQLSGVSHDMANAAPPPAASATPANWLSQYANTTCNTTCAALDPPILEFTDMASLGVAGNSLTSLNAGHGNRPGQQLLPTSLDIAGVALGADDDPLAPFALDVGEVDALLASMHDPGLGLSGLGGDALALATSSGATAGALQDVWGTYHGS
jgi:hypothetical protein